jgi:riboflavin biosynthesis pyrimidine reductase
MRSLWSGGELDGGELDDAALERRYAYPEPLTRPWVQVNFVSSVDGAVTIEGRSGGLGNPADKKIFQLGRKLADVIMVGAGTARAERYGGVKFSAEVVARRVDRGQAERPPVAVVTRSGEIPLDSPLFTDTRVPPIVLTCAGAPTARRKDLLAAGADVIVAGDEVVDLHTAVNALDERGLRRINCEGGPMLFGELVERGLVDDLCVTVVPLVSGGTAPRMTRGLFPEIAREMDLLSVIHADGTLLLRYRLPK